MDEYFIRNFEIETLKKDLTFYQCTIGDVGCVVWDAALSLAKYLEVSCANNSWIKGKKILELGAGVGCVGIVAACLGGIVTATDLPEILPLLQKNIDANREQIDESGGKICAEILRWGDVESTEPTAKPDIILLADVIYYEESVKPLVSTLVSLSDESTVILMSQEKRWSEKQKSIWDAFYDHVCEYFQFSSIPKNEQHPDYYCGDIMLLSGKRLKCS